MKTITKKSVVEQAKKEGIKLPNLNKEDTISYYEAYLKEQKYLQSLEDTEKKARTNTFLKKLANPVAVYMDEESDFLTHYQEKGWAVVPVLTEEETKEVVSMYFDRLESCCTSFSRDDHETWKNDNLPYNVHGIFKDYFGQTKEQWYVREKCVPVFEKLLEVEGKDLLCSFDGFCFLSGRMAVKSKGKHWIHCDTPRNGEEYPDCTQGIVNLLENGAKDGGLILVEGSHLIQKDYYDTYPTYGYTWGKADISYHGFEDKRVIKVCAPAGSIILFNGKTFHCNTPPTKKDSLRLAVYVSMQPRSCVTEKELKKRIETYEKGLMTGHWCYGKWFSANAKYGRAWQIKNIPSEREVAELNEVTKRLVGY